METKWLLCPICGRKTHNKIREDKVKKTKFTPELIHEFIDRIIVYTPRHLDGKRVQ